MTKAVETATGNTKLVDEKEDFVEGLKGAGFVSTRSLGDREYNFESHDRAKSKDDIESIAGRAKSVLLKMGFKVDYEDGPIDLSRSKPLATARITVPAAGGLVARPVLVKVLVH